MSTSKSCREPREQIAAFLLDELPADRAAAVRSHLEMCASCRASAREMAATLDLLRDALAAPSPAAARLAPARVAAIRTARPRRARPPALTFAIRFAQAAATVLVLLGIAALFMPALSVSRNRAFVARLSSGDEVSCAIALPEARREGVAPELPPPDAAPAPGDAWGMSWSDGGRREAEALGRGAAPGSGLAVGGGAGGFAHDLAASARKEFAFDDFADGTIAADRASRVLSYGGTARPARGDEVAPGGATGSGKYRDAIHEERTGRASASAGWRGEVSERIAAPRAAAPPPAPPAAPRPAPEPPPADHGAVAAATGPAAEGEVLDAGGAIVMKGLFGGRSSVGHRRALTRAPDSAATPAESLDVQRKLDPVADKLAESTYAIVNGSTPRLRAGSEVSGADFAAARTANRLERRTEEDGDRPVGQTVTEGRALDRDVNGTAPAGLPAAVLATPAALPAPTRPAPAPRPGLPAPGTPAVLDYRYALGNGEAGAALSLADAPRSDAQPRSERGRDGLASEVSKSSALGLGDGYLTPADESDKKPAGGKDAERLERLARAGDLDARKKAQETANEKVREMAQLEQEEAVIEDKAEAVAGQAVQVGRLFRGGGAGGAGRAKEGAAKLEPAKPDGVAVAMQEAAEEVAGPPPLQEMKAELQSVQQGPRQEVREVAQAMSQMQQLAEAVAEPASEPVFEPAGFNPYVEAAKNAFSTFSIDVDTASFALARRYVLEGRRPPPESVRTEEFVNAFEYDYPPPAGAVFGVYAAWADAPFRPGLQLLRVGVKGRRIGRDQERPSALTLVVDTSGSMNTPDRLGLVQRALPLLVGALHEGDTVALVTFDTEPRLLLGPTPVARKAEILAAIEAMTTSGSTHLERGLRLGYEVAARAFRSGAMNRVLLLSDGAANLGEGKAETILRGVEAFRRQGIYLSVFGLGTGTYNDAMLEALADKGDGTYTFMDSIDEARRVLVDELSATLHAIARDAKIQVQFDPARVVRYRQIGYENRRLTREQFRDDTVDAGEVGSGQSVTALYEVELAPGASRAPLATVRVRYRDTASGRIEEIERRVGEAERAAAGAPAWSFRVAAAAAEFAEVLRLSPYASGTDLGEVADYLRPVALERPLDERLQDFLRLVQSASRLPPP